MKWSWKIARFVDIDIFVHATFFILLLWVGLSYWAMEQTMAAVVEGLSFVLALFVCVVLHEFGHALTARRYGIATEKITLLPIGGVASLERMPDDPRQEIQVALAGPVVNIIIALLIWLWLLFTGSWISWEQFSFTEGSFLQRLMLINVVLGVFNMLPAFPMDGGRVLRASLAMRMDRVKATRIAANVGQALALWLGFLGLLYNPFLVIIALFIWIGAAAESSMEQVKSTIHDMEAGRAMIKDFQVLSEDDQLSRAIELTLSGAQKAFPVLRDGQMIGVLNQADLLIGLQAYGEECWVTRVMQTEVLGADIHEPLEKVLERMQKNHSSLVSVNESGRFVGIVDLENIMELINIQNVLNDRDEETRFSA